MADVLRSSLGRYSGQNDEYNHELESVQGVGHGTFSWIFPVIVEERMWGFLPYPWNTKNRR